MAQQYNSAKELKGLSVGANVPMFTALNLKDEKIELTELLKNGPVVIMFYRGQWCPICNKHLKNLQDSLQAIYDKGAYVLAISPERSEFLKRTAEKTKASFDLLHDEDYKISKAYDVLFRPDSVSRFMYNTILRANLSEAHSDNSEQLPIPATFIISKDGKVVWRHFDPDYKKRSSIKDIIANIPN